MRVLWLHNNGSRQAGSFMWDILDRLRGFPGMDLSDLAIPVVRSLADLRALFGAGRPAGTPALVHAQFGSLVALVAALRPARRRIVSLRGSDTYWRYGGLSDRIGGLIRVGMTWLGCLRADAVVVMSRAMQRRVARWPLMGRRPIHVIVDPAGEMFWPAATRNLAGRLAERRFVVLVASLVATNPIKRLHLVAAAADLCRRAGLSVELHQLSGQSREAVREAIAGCDTIALASTHEGWPNIVKEGLLLGRPFVATDVGDLAEHAAPGSNNAIVAADPLDFACAWVEQIAVTVAAADGVRPELAAFHPDVCAIKHQLLYLAYQEDN